MSPSCLYRSASILIHYSIPYSGVVEFLNLFWPRVYVSFARGGSTLILPNLERRRHDFIDAFFRPMPFGDTVPHLFAFRLNFLQQFFFVQAKILPIVDQCFAVDDDRSHVAAHGGFHQRSNWIAHSAKGNIPEIDDSDIGFRAFL